MKKNTFYLLIGLSLNVILTAIPGNAWAVKIIRDYQMNTYDQVILELYQNPQLKTTNMTQRIDIISAYFLGKPYVEGPLGEGKSAPFDQAPLYRTDAFDCLTYVSTVLALAESNNLNEFKKNLLEIQYRQADPTFVNRLHFTSIDWNATNERNGFIRDITPSFKDAQGNSIAKTAYAVINKPAWYQKMTSSNLHLLHSLSLKEEQERLIELQNLSRQVSIEKSIVSYLPLTALFNAKGKPNQQLFNQIPSGTIIEIVRPNWNLVQQIGTHLNISHLGFAIRTSKGLMFREASSLEHRVVDIPLTAYLKGYLDSTTVKGIHVEKEYYLIRK